MLRRRRPPRPLRIITERVMPAAPSFSSASRVVSKVSLVHRRQHRIIPGFGADANTIASPAAASASISYNCDFCAGCAAGSSWIRCTPADAYESPPEWPTGGARRQHRRVAVGEEHTAHVAAELSPQRRIIPSPRPRHGRGRPSAGRYLAEGYLFQEQPSVTGRDQRLRPR